MANNPYLMVRYQTEPHFLSDPMSDRKKKVLPTLRNIYKKQHGARPCVEKMQLIFLFCFLYRTECKITYI
jgi:hypothetical protein